MLGSTRSRLLSVPHHHGADRPDAATVQPQLSLRSRCSPWKCLPALRLLMMPAIEIGHTKNPSPVRVRRGVVSCDGFGVSYLMLEHLRSTGTLLPCSAAIGRQAQNASELGEVVVQHVVLLVLQGPRAGPSIGQCGSCYRTILRHHMGATTDPSTPLSRFAGVHFGIRMSPPSSTPARAVVVVWNDSRLPPSSGRFTLSPNPPCFNWI